MSVKAIRRGITAAILIVPPVSASSSASPRARREEGGVVLRTGGHQVRRGRDTEPARRRVWLREGVQSFLLFFFLLLPVSFQRDYLCFLSFAPAPTPTPTPAATKTIASCLFSLSSASSASSFLSQTSNFASSTSRRNREAANRVENLRNL